MGSVVKGWDNVSNVCDVIKYMGYMLQTSTDLARIINQLHMLM